MLFPCQRIAGRMVKSLFCFGGRQALAFFSLSFFFNSGYYKAIFAVSKKNIIKFHFENVKTKCFGISEVKHFIKNAASECFDIF